MTHKWCNHLPLCLKTSKHLTIIELGWAKYRDLSVASRSIIAARSPRYFAQPRSIIVLSFDDRVCFFNEYPREAKRSAIFTQEWSQKGEKHGCTQLDDIAHEQTIICRQWFAGHVVGSRPMKRKKNLLRMKITLIDVYLLLCFGLRIVSKGKRK